jgi:uncharacterized protein
MRRSEREIKDPKVVQALLERAHVGRLATVNGKGYPVIKPVNFIFRQGRVYFHSSTKGEKMTDLRRKGPVCFEVDEPVAYLAAQGPACGASYYYRSVILKGKAVLVGRREKKEAILLGLMEKYQPEGGYGEISLDALGRTTVVEIIPEEITGKENLG